MDSSAITRFSDTEQLPEEEENLIQELHKREVLVADTAAVKVKRMIDFCSAFVAFFVAVNVAVRCCYNVLLSEDLSATFAVAAFAESGSVAGCGNSRVNNFFTSESFNFSGNCFVAARAGYGFGAFLCAGRFLGNNPFATPIVTESLDYVALLCCAAICALKNAVTVVNAGYAVDLNVVIMLKLCNSLFFENVAAAADTFGVSRALFGAGGFFVNYPLALNVAEHTKLLFNRKVAACALSDSLTGRSAG